MVVSKVHYAIYTRQSTHDSGKVLSSCDVQFGICQDFALSCLSPSANWIGERFDDIGESGANIKRPALKRLLEWAEKDILQTVIVYRLDRLSRNLLDCLSILQNFRENEIELSVVTAPGIGSIATDDFMLNLAASYAQFERDLIRSRIADAREYLKRKGYRIAGPTPYGYDSDPRTKQLTPDPTETPHIETIFQMAADGVTPLEIAGTINSLGWRTRPSKSVKSREQLRGNLWSPRQILTTLHNPVYAGMFADGNGVRKGNHQAIISDRTFFQANQHITSRRSEKKPADRSRFWALRGKIECPECGRIMSTHTTNKNNRRYRHYRCRSHAGGRPPCKGSAFPAIEIEQIVIDQLCCQPLGIVTNPSIVEVFSQFQKIWPGLGGYGHAHLLPTVIKQVNFSPDESTLRIQLNIDAVEKIAYWTKEQKKDFKNKAKYPSG